MDYNLKFSNRKTLNITVERDRKVIVHAPNNTPLNKIEEIVYSKRFWIKEKINHSQKYPIEPEKKEFISGESILYLGKNYQLLIVDEKLDGIKFNQSFSVSKTNQKQANILLKQWYKKKAESKIIPLAKSYSKKLGVAFNACKIAEMKYRWGSCTPKNNINFNWRIIKAPMNVIEYIIVHELVHLLENNHTSRFWHILSIQLPNYSKAKSWLKEKGHLLEIDF